MFKTMLDPRDIYLIIHTKSKQALQLSSKGAFVELGPSNENNHKQLWLIKNQDKGKFKIISASSDKVLTVEDNIVIVKQDNNFFGQKSQQWQIDTSTPDVIRLMCYSSGQYLGALKKKCVMQKLDNVRQGQTWQLRKLKYNKILEKSCYIQCSQTGKNLQIPESKEEYCMQLCLGNPHYRFNQRFQLHNIGEVYIIKNIISGLNVDIQGESKQTATKIIQYGSTGGANQFWQLQQQQNGHFRIASWMDNQLQIGHDGNKIVTFKGRKYAWKIGGYIPQLSINNFFQQQIRQN